MSQLVMIPLKYNIASDTMLSESRKVCVGFKEDQAKFVTFDQDFKTPYEIDWELAIKSGEENPDDSAIVADIKVDTEDVEIEMKACREVFQDAKYFINKAFPNKTAIWQQFGYNHYESARKNHDKMFRFMTNFHATALLYKTELIAKGYTLERIDNILVVRDALNTELIIQQRKIDSRAVATYNRHTILNNVWDYRVKVATAAKEIFEKDTPSYRFYLLPESNATPENANVKGEVTEVGTGKVLENVMINLGNHVPIMFSNEKGIFLGDDVPADNYTAHITLDGYMEKDVSMNVEEGQVFIIHIELEKYKAK